MIVKLTQEQEKMLEVYKNKYINIGLNIYDFETENEKREYLLLEELKK